MSLAQILHWRYLKINAFTQSAIEYSSHTQNCLYLSLDFFLLSRLCTIEFEFARPYFRSINDTGTSACFPSDLPPPTENHLLPRWISLERDESTQLMRFYQRYYFWMNTRVELKEKSTDISQKFSHRPPPPTSHLCTTNCIYNIKQSRQIPQFWRQFASFLTSNQEHTSIRQIWRHLDHIRRQIIEFLTSNQK